MRFNLEWFDGAPERFERGMVLENRGGTIVLVGDIDEEMCIGAAPEGILAQAMDNVERWAWLVRPHELDWLEDMARKHRKGKDA